MSIAAETTASPYLDGLNPQQRAAVLHGEGSPAGPLLVIAGAGTGKTATLAHRLAHLVVNGADPRRILLMTFTRRAAAEMLRRAQNAAAKALGPKAAILADGLSWAGTFHAIGARLLREYAPLVGLPADFTIHDRQDSADLMNLVRHQLGYSRTGKRFPAKSTCLAIYSRAVNGREELAEVLARHYSWCAGWEAELKSLFAAYVEAKQASGVLDYDDLLLCWAEIMGEPALAAEIGAMFDHVLVDEYQDTNRLQAAILLGLKPDGRGVTVVGDDAQSIYAFRAAEVRNILDFPTLFSPQARVIALERNYRSTPQILEAANAVLSEAGEGYAKRLWSERPAGPGPALVTVRDESGQVDHVCRQILEAREIGVQLKEQAVLFRTAHHSNALEVELVRRDIPFVKFGGLKFLEAAHVKDLLGVLRFAQNPTDRIAGFRALQLLPGVGPSIAEAILEAMAGAVEPADALAAYRAPSPAVGSLADFAELFMQLRRGAIPWPAEIERARAWYEPHLERLHDDASMRRSDLVQLERIATASPTRERFLTDLALDPPDATSAEAGAPHRDEDYLILSTIHSAKGREWKQVFVLNCVDGCIPSDMATGTREEIEEERRLLYVAMTRAKDTLHLLQPLRFYTHGQSRRGDRHVYAGGSRLITEAVLKALDVRTWTDAGACAAAGANPSVPGSPKLDLKTALSKRWQ